MRIERSDVYEYDEARGGFFLKDGLELVCPHCESRLRKHDRCSRYIRLPGGTKVIVTLQRMKCTNSECRRVHRILPDGVLPFRQYVACCIQQVVLEGSSNRIVCEESTMRNWRGWFHRIREWLHEAIHKAFECGLTSSESLDDVQQKRPNDWLRNAVSLAMQAFGGVATHFAS